MTKNDQEHQLNRAMLYFQCIVFFYQFIFTKMKFVIYFMLSCIFYYDLDVFVIVWCSTVFIIVVPFLCFFLKLWIFIFLAIAIVYGIYCLYASFLRSFNFFYAQLQLRACVHTNEQQMFDVRTTFFLFCDYSFICLLKLSVVDQLKKQML